MSEPSGHQGQDRAPRSIGGHGANDAFLPEPAGGHVDDLATGYALGALEGSERLRVERHRQMCPACDRLIADESRVVGLLPFAVPLSDVPPDVKPAILARVDHAGRAAAPGTPAPRSVPPPASRVEARGAPLPTLPTSRQTLLPLAPSHPMGAPPRIERWTGWASTLLALPLLLALIATAAWAVQLRAEADEDEARANSFGAMLERALSGQETVYQLSPAPRAPDAKGWVVAAADGRSATLYVRGAPTRPGSSVELIASGEGEPVPLVTIELDERGRGVATFPLRQPLTDFRFLRVKASSDDGPNGLALWGKPIDPKGTPAAGNAVPAPTVGTDTP